MTHCVAIQVNAGLVFCSDSRTNAGVDPVHCYKEMYTFGAAGQRQLVMLSAGNLATTHGVLNPLRDDIDGGAAPDLLTTTSLHQTAEHIGQVSRAQQAKTGGGPSFSAFFILGGPIAGKETDPPLIARNRPADVASERERAARGLGRPSRRA